MRCTYSPDTRLDLLDRRQILAGAAAVAGSALLPAMARAQSAPSRGGLLRIAVSNGSSADSLDPAGFASAQQICLGFALRNNLTEIAADGSLAPELAESWESADARIWRFRLRSGVTFHNGKSLAPEDVVASLNHHRGEDAKSGAATLLSGVAEIRADGPDGVVVELAAPNADFPIYLSDYHLGICPLDTSGALDLSGVGTGGYVLESFSPGQRSTLTRNPDYWKQGAAWFDAGEVVLISDPTARTAALISGQVDAVGNLELKTVDRLAATGRVLIDSVPSATHVIMAMNAGIEPFGDRNVRLALKHGIDRDALIRIVAGGHASVANDQPVAPSMPYFNPELPQRAYDPERSRFHLREAGLDSLEVALSTADGIWPGAVDAAQLYAEQAAAGGISVRVAREPADGYWSNVWLQKPFVTSLWAARPTPDMIFSQAYETGAVWNETGFSNARFDSLLREARGELDPAKRGEMYGEMQRLVHEESGAVIPFFKNYVFGRAPGVAHGEQVGSDWQLDGFKAFERWWMA
ncbi:MAG: ABC transporter substrate-binding protein [Pikeienuella sp.]